MDAIRQFCAECGREMTRRVFGAWNLCCKGLGYWANVDPLPRDSWFPVVRRGWMTFYPTAKWPADRKPTQPAGQHGDE